MARLPRPRLPSGRRIRERFRRRRDQAEPAAGREADRSLEERAEELRRLLYGEGEGPPDRRPRRGAALGRRLRAAPGALASSAGGGLRRLRYALGDVAFAAGRAGRAAARGAGSVAAELRALWLRLSLSARRRIAAGAGLAAAAAVLWLAVVPNLPCQFPAGETCPPGDDAIGLVPGDAYAYIHANVDPETEQYRAAARVADRLPSVSAQLIDLVRDPGGRPLDFTTRIRPWADGELAMAIVPGEAARDERLLLVEVADPDGAREFVEQSAAGPLTDEEHRGVTMQVDEQGSAGVLLDDFLAFGAEAAVRRAIDVREGEARSLTSSALVTQVLDELPDQSVVEVAVSEDGIGELLGPDEALGALDPFVNFEASRGVGAALVADGDAVELSVRSVLDPELLEGSPGFFGALPPFAPELAGELSPESLLYLGLGNPGASLQRLLDQAAAGAPGIAESFDQLSEQLRRRDRIDLGAELAALLEGEAAIGIERGDPVEDEGAGPEEEAEIPGADIAPPDGLERVPPEDLLPPEGAPPPPGVVAPTGVPYLLLVVEDVDTERARGALARLQGPIARALDPQETGQAPVFSKDEVDGVETRSLRLSRTVNLTYATFDGKLVVATDPEGIAQVRDDSGGLPESEAFEDATEELPDQPALITYLNLASLVVLAEREGLAADPRYAFFAADIRRLSGLGLAVESSPTSLETTMRVTTSD